MRVQVRSASGSSPLARGLLAGADGERSRLRIIPARAGFTRRHRRLHRRRGDHPRSRGVYPPRRRRLCASPGSSPLARGLRHRRPRQQGLRRIIPARAGFTPWAAGRSSCTTDHPRSRGVYTPEQVAAEWHCGSSPLARGLQEWVAARRAAGGIIPARAGFTAGRRRSRAGSGDHPRSRGVYAPRAHSSM